MLKILTVIWIVLTFFIFASASAANETEDYYYAIEQNGVISGYAHVIIMQMEFDGRSSTQLIDSLWMKMSALGKSFESEYRFEYRINPLDGMYFYHTSYINQGGTKMGGIMEVYGDSMCITSENGGDTSFVFLPSGTIRQSTRIYRHFVDYFVRDTLNQKECFVFSEVDGKVNTITFFNRGVEKLELAGKTYEALAVESFNRTTGVQIRMWVDAETGLLLKMLHPYRDIYLSDAKIKERIKRADLNDYLLARVNKVITDPWAISYMKVQAKLQPGGMWVTPEGLNVPGQKFKGIVDDNRIDGVFEISHERYDGSNAPLFPSDFSNIDSLQVYLNPSEMIESNDSSLVRKAREITVGSKDAWEAATRLSKWVYEEIIPDIPGGGTALKTFELRLGECGSHSNLLTAFCRAVGIPARGVFGCMYMPNYGGAFGQHAWNEIYMGKAGWIPVDCTVKEISYVDCGHIRFGEWISTAAMFNPDKMEILDYQIAKDLTDNKSESATQTMYDSYFGKYQGKREVLSIVLQNGNLGLDIPGRMIFKLNNPDTNGNWFFKLSNAASVSFEKDSAAEVSSLTINEYQLMPRKPLDDSVTIDPAIPKEYRPFIGEYVIPMQNVSLVIAYLDNQFSLRLPGDRIVALKKSEINDQWLGERSQNSKMVISFDSDEMGEISAMRLKTLTICPKITSVGSE